MLKFIFVMPGYYLLPLLLLITYSITLLTNFVINHWAPNTTKATDNTGLAAISRAPVTIFAVLVAFIAISTLNTYNKAQNLVRQESGLINSIYHSVDSMPPVVAKDVHDNIKAYTYHVIYNEWPDMQRGIINTSAMTDLNRISANIAHYHLNTTEITLLNKTLEQINKLYEVRRERVALTDAAISTLVWIVLILFSLLLIVINIFIVIESKITKYVSLFSVDFSISLIFFLLIAFDHPFTGDLAVSKYPLELQLNIMKS